MAEPKGSKISKTEWGLVIGATLVADIIQIALNFVAVGVLVNRFIDIGVGAALIFYFWLRKVHLDTRALFSLGATFAAEEVPILDIAPFWTLDVFYIRSLDNARKAKQAAHLAENAEDMDRVA